MHSEAGIIATVTSYQPLMFNNIAHCHNNAHFSYMLEGACAEKKKSGYDIRPGQLVYYSAGEQHQVTHVGKTCRRVNVEMEQRFLTAAGITGEAARNAISARPDAKFFMVKMCKELHHFTRVFKECIGYLPKQYLKL